MGAIYNLRCAIITLSAEDSMHAGITASELFLATEI